jgi:hypothetical protein
VNERMAQQWLKRFARWTASGTTTDLGQWGDQRSWRTTTINKYEQIIRHTWPFKEYYSSPSNSSRKNLQEL